MLKNNYRITEEEIIKLRNILKKFPFIQVAYLFGSHVKDRITPLSDIDIALLSEKNFQLMKKLKYIGKSPPSFIQIKLM